MADEKPPFEIIEDTPPEPKTKRKRYRRPLFGHIPWRWVGAAFTAGIILVGIVIWMLVPHQPELIYYAVVTATPAAITPVPLPSPTASAPPYPPVNTTPIPVGETVLDMDESGAWMAVAGSASLRLYQNGALVHLLESYGNDPPYLRLADVAFSPTAGQVAILMFDGRAEPEPVATLTIYEVASGMLLRAEIAYRGTSGDNITGLAMAYSPDGKQLAFGEGKGWIVLMDTTTGEVLATLNTRANDIFALAFSADSQRLTMITRVGSGLPGDHNSAQIQVWDVSNPASTQQIIQHSVALEWPIRNFEALSLNGRYAALLLNRDQVEFWDLDTNTQLGHFIFDPLTIIEGITISPTGDKLAFVQRDIQPPTQTQTYKVAETVTLRVINWSYQDNEFRYSDLYPPLELSTRGAYQLHLSQDQNRLDYIPLDTRNVMRWNFDTGQITMMNI